MWVTVVCSPTLASASRSHHLLWSCHHPSHLGQVPHSLLPPPRGTGARSQDLVLVKQVHQPPTLPPQTLLELRGSGSGAQAWRLARGYVLTLAFQLLSLQPRSGLHSLRLPTHHGFWILCHKHQTPHLQSTRDSLELSAEAQCVAQLIHNI